MIDCKQMIHNRSVLTEGQNRQNKFEIQKNNLANFFDLFSDRTAMASWFWQSKPTEEGD